MSYTQKENECIPSSFVRGWCGSQTCRRRFSIMLRIALFVDRIILEHRWHRCRFELFYFHIFFIGICCEMQRAYDSAPALTWAPQTVLFTFKRKKINKTRPDCFPFFFEYNMALLFLLSKITKKKKKEKKIGTYPLLRFLWSILRGDLMMEIREMKFHCLFCRARYKVARNSVPFPRN